MIVHAEQQPSSAWLVTSQEVTHDGTTAILTDLPDETVPDAADIPQRYGDIVGCAHPPLFS